MLSLTKIIRIGKRSYKIIRSRLGENGQRARIPTTFVPLSPNKIGFENGVADLLFGLFHIMWADMPRPKTYAIKLCDLFSSSGEYLGSKLECSHPMGKKFCFL